MEVIQAADGARHSTPMQSGLINARDEDRTLQEPGEFLIFRLAGEEYGIDILRVQEIRSYTTPTLIANAPDYVKGVINLRGMIVPILDMRLKFGLKSEYNAFTVVIVLNLKQRTVGLVVDAVSDVLALHGTQIRPVPQFSTTTDTGFITGIGSAPSDDQDRMLILVDVERLVSSADDRLPDTEGMDLIGL